MTVKAVSMIPILDRSENRRNDDAMLTVAREDPDSRFILFNVDQALLNRDSAEPVVFTGQQLKDLDLSNQAAVLLGFYGDIAWFGLDIQGVGASAQGEVDGFERFTNEGDFVSLASIDSLVKQETWALLAQARSLLAWNRGTAHCPICGGSTIARNGGYHRICLNSNCARTHFPRTDPAVIVRVLHADRCLLARQPRFRDGLRSVIAGFVEPGESFEDAVRREVREEAGLEVGPVRYLGSQPWPFPMSIMIAFEACALSDAITIDGNELESAAWYTRNDAREEMAAGTLVLPSLKSIARQMIDGWLANKDSL